MLKDLRLFLSAVRNDFYSTGAIAPSSSLLAKAILTPMTQRRPRPVAVLEAGPGTGSFTGRILECLREGDLLDIFEVNPKFCIFLRDFLKSAGLAERGIRWEIFNADIRSLDRPIQYDYIISGLPLFNFDPLTVNQILDCFIGHLAADGVLPYFEYTLFQDFRARLLRGSNRQRLIGVVNIVRTFNQKHQFSCDRVWWNLPPAKARHCRKSN